MNLEELFATVLEYYDVFKRIMKTGTEEEKRYAIMQSNDLKRMVAAKLKEKEGIDYQKIEKLFEHEPRLREVKEELQKISEELEPLIKVMEKNIDPEKAAKIRKKQMERKLRMKG